MPGDVVDRVRAICADVFDVPLDRIHGDSSPETVEAWDSVQHLNLVLALEQEFDTSFSPEEMDGITSIGAIAALIESRQRR